MKIHHRQTPAGILIELSGEIDEDECNCMSHFWDKFVADDEKQVEIDLRGVSRITPSGIEFLCSAIKGHLLRGTNVRLHHAPTDLRQGCKNAGFSPETDLFAAED